MHMPSLCVLSRLFFLAAALATPGFAQQTSTTNESVVVTGDELPSAYGAPPSFSRTRFAPLTTAYVLPPGSILSATIYENDAFRHGRPDNLFTQEIEVGLPYRFGLAVETSLQHYGGITQPKTTSLEVRYALADWNKIPLNPTIFVEYKFAIGRILHDEALNQPAEGDVVAPPPDALRSLSGGSGHRARRESASTTFPEQPDAVEGRLLLSQDFGDRVEWAANGFFERETGGDRGREWGFAQSIVTPLAPREILKVGVEMQYLNFSDKGIRDDPEHRFIIGPTIAWKPARWCRLDVSELFGVTADSERARTFVVFSMLLGGPGKAEAEAPVSTRNR